MKLIIGKTLKKTALFYIKNNSFILYPERGIYWEEEKALLIADLHLGKAASFRASGIPLPGGTTTENLKRLQLLIDKTSPEKLIVIGDLLHSKKGKTEKTLEVFKQWRNKNKNLKILLIPGNHDKRSGILPDDFNIKYVAEPFEINSFLLSHNPQDVDNKYVISGHLHPSVYLRGKGRESLRLPCFYFGKTCGVLPSFGSFTGTYLIEPKPEDNIFVIANDEVIKVKC